MITKPNPSKKIGKKKQVLANLFSSALNTGNMFFGHAELVHASQAVQFRNHNDAVKIDRSSLLPDSMREKDYYLIHLGEGRYRFVKSISIGYHKFESIPEKNIKPWQYRRSILNQIDTSEANILSVGMNQRILHDFLYEDITVTPKTYNARRTKRTLSYTLNNETVIANNLQMELDMTCEHQKQVTIFEGKNGLPEDFAVYQLFHPFLYFRSLQENKENPIPIKVINCCYFLRQVNKQGATTIRVYLYSFAEKNPASINLQRCAEYQLIER